MTTIQVPAGVGIGFDSYTNNDDSDLSDESIVIGNDYEIEDHPPPVSTVVSKTARKNRRLLPLASKTSKQPQDENRVLFSSYGKGNGNTTTTTKLPKPFSQSENKICRKKPKLLVSDKDTKKKVTKIPKIPASKKPKSPSKIKIATATNNTSSSNDGRIVEETWNMNFNKLFEFYRRNGHSNVLRSDKDQKLSGWVKRQRNNSKEGKLTAVQVARLNNLDFIWNRIEGAWYAKYNQLKKFASENGHCHVPTKFNRSLAEWTQRQRREYRCHQPTMTFTRIQKLESIPSWNWNKGCKDEMGTRTIPIEDRMVERQQGPQERRDTTTIDGYSGETTPRIRPSPWNHVATVPSGDVSCDTAIVIGEEESCSTPPPRVVEVPPADGHCGSTTAIKKEAARITPVPAAAVSAADDCSDTALVIGDESAGASSPVPTAIVTVPQQHAYVSLYDSVLLPAGETDGAMTGNPYMSLYDPVLLPSTKTGVPVPDQVESTSERSSMVDGKKGVARSYRPYKGSNAFVTSAVAPKTRITAKRKLVVTKSIRDNHVNTVSDGDGDSSVNRQSKSIQDKYQSKKIRIGSTNATETPTTVDDGIQDQGAGNPRRASLRTKPWMKMYQRLAAFKKKFGTTYVPLICKEDPQLGQWISQQREKCTEKDRIDLLNKIGFDWHSVGKE